MSQPAAEKWDQRYSKRDKPGPACRVLRENAHLLPAQGKSLDLACGLGGNALLLAKQGLDSHAWDYSAVALKTLNTFAAASKLTIHTEQRDVEQCPPEQHSFDVIVVSQFLYRPMLPALAMALRPGGLLFYQTFNRSKASTQGPSNPDYLLAPNELLKAFSSLELIYYREEGKAGDISRGLRDCSCYIGKKSV